MSKCAILLVRMLGCINLIIQSMDDVVDWEIREFSLKSLRCIIEKWKGEDVAKKGPSASIE